MNESEDEVQVVPVKTEEIAKLFSEAETLIISPTHKPLQSRLKRNRRLNFSIELINLI